MVENKSFIVELSKPSGDATLGSQATTTVIWCISMVFLFLDLPLLLHRFRELLIKRPEQLIAPAWAEEKLLAIALAAERALGTPAERLGSPPMLAA